jgi:hypothetical protein
MKKKVEKEERLSLTRIWSEVKSDHTDEEGVTHIDAFITKDDNEAGSVIAHIDLDGVVKYNVEAAKTDELAQEIIKKVVDDKLADKQKLVDQVVKWIIFECDGTEFNFGDSTAIELLLMSCKTENLTAYLPEGK